MDNAASAISFIPDDKIPMTITPRFVFRSMVFRGYVTESFATWYKQPAHKTPPYQGQHTIVSYPALRAAENQSSPTSMLPRNKLAPRRRALGLLIQKVCAKGYPAL